MSYEHNGYTMPERTEESLKRYVDKRTPTGGFLEALLSNDLFDAFSKGDIENIANMYAIVAYVYNVMPSTCWGSREKVKAWLGSYDVDV